MNIFEWIIWINRSEFTITIALQKLFQLLDWWRLVFIKRTNINEITSQSLEIHSPIIRVAEVWGYVKEAYANICACDRRDLQTSSQRSSLIGRLICDAISWYSLLQISLPNMKTVIIHPLLINRARRPSGHASSQTVSGWCDFEDDSSPSSFFLWWVYSKTVRLPPSAFSCAN